MDELPVNRPANPTFYSAITQGNEEYAVDISQFNTFFSAIEEINILNNSLRYFLDTGRHPIILDPLKSYLDYTNQLDHFTNRLNNYLVRMIRHYIARKDVSNNNKYFTRYQEQTLRRHSNNQTSTSRNRNNEQQ